jgi:cell wall-associated NlpC family hydrolase
MVNYLQGDRMSILRYIGIPYVVGGESFEASDCYGICKLYAKNELNLILPTYMYSNLDNEAVAEVAIKAAAHGLGDKWEKVSEPKHGDVLTFRIFGHEVHCGIVLDNPTQFLHSLKGRTSCMEELSHVNWKHRLTGVYRWNNN